MLLIQSTSDLVAHLVNQKSATKSKVATKFIVDTHGVSINSEFKGAPTNILYQVIQSDMVHICW